MLADGRLGNLGQSLRRRDMSDGFCSVQTHGLHRNMTRHLRQTGTSFDSLIDMNEWFSLMSIEQHFPIPVQGEVIKQRTYSTSTSTTPTTIMSRCPTGEDHGALYCTQITTKGSTADPDPHSYWSAGSGSAFILVGWIRIRIENTDLDPDPRGPK